MKKILISLIIVLTTITSQAQVKKNGSTVRNNNNQNYETAIYKLYPTKNVWTFIKLNTRNGQMWQVQFDVIESNRSEKILNSESLVSKDKEVNGRFDLYSTQNMYNFLLLDQLDGKMWQAQWSMEIENRGVVPIE